MFYNNYCYTACPSNTFLLSGVCQACSTNCLTCAGTASTCTSCDPISSTPYLDTATNTCINLCAAGKVLIGNSCQPCASPCATCASTTTTCLTCLSGYLYGTTCVTTCPAGTFLNTATQQCQACASTCATCSSASACLTCNPAGSTPYLYNGQCVNVCPSNTYLSGTTCLACNSNCQTCSGSSTYCTSCPTTGTKTILSATNTCVASCDAGYIQVNGRCTACISPCATCMATTTTCTSCLNGLYLYGSTCQSSCPTGTYLDITSRKCISCDPKCSTCTSATTCQTCQSQYPLMQNGMCMSSCSDGYYKSGTNCLPCSSNCQTCVNTDSYCLSCKLGSSYPLLSSSNTCITTCDSGYLAVSGKCVQCERPCSTCIVDVSSCKTCSTSTYLYGTECVTGCPSGYTQQNQKCVGCDPNCLSCSSLDSTACLQCKNTYLLYENTCYQGCPEGFTPDSTNQKCIVPGSEGGDIFIYFPFLTTQTVLTGISVGSKLKSPASLFFSSTIALYGGLELMTYSAQVILAFNFEILGSNSVVPSSKMIDVVPGTGRRLQDSENILISNDYYDLSGKPIVFWGTMFAFIFWILANVLWVILYFVIVNRDEGFQIYRSNFPCTSRSIFIVSAILSYKIARFFYCSFFGLEKFNATFANPKRIHYTFNFLTLFNIFFTLLPIIFVDIYGLIKYNWGTQFYIIIIETLLLSIAILILSILEFRVYQISNHQYAPGTMMNTNMEEELYRRLEEKFKLKHIHEIEEINTMREGGLGPRMVGGPDMVASGFMDESNAAMLPPQDNQLLKNHQKKKAKGAIDEEVNDYEEGQHLKKRQSFIDVNQLNKERDDRRIATDPTNNRYKPKKQSSHISVEEAQEEVKKDSRNLGNEGSEQSLKRKLKKADERKGERGIEPNGENLNDERSHSAQKKMRGRSNKYYEAVQEEDDSMRAETQGEKTERGTERPLLDGDNTMRQSDCKSDEENQKEAAQKDSIFKKQKDEKKFHTEEQKKLEQDIIDEEDSNIFQEENVEGDVKQNKQGNKNSQGEIEDKSEGRNELKKEGSQKSQKKNVQVLDDGKEEVNNKRNSQQLDPMGQTYQCQVLEEEILKEKQEEEEKERQQNQSAQKTQPKPKTTKELENEIADFGRDDEENTPTSSQLNRKLSSDPQDPQFQQNHNNGMAVINGELGQDLSNKQDQNKKGKNKGSKGKDSKNGKEWKGERGKSPSKEQKDKSNRGQKSDRKREGQQSSQKDEMGEPDSDDDEDNRIKNMTDPEKRKFNVHDILGDFDRDEKGNLIIKKNSQGQMVDKKGRRVNEKGYLIDSKTGDVIENSKNKKVFDRQELDERGEIPPPFNLEKLNFNPHDIRGYFDRDENGNEIIGNRRNSQGRAIDKLGRLVNKDGYLVDKNGNLVDKRGRLRLHKKLLNQGDISSLLNYKGKKFDIKDIIGEFDKDRKGNIIIRRDKDNQMVDKKGRRVNQKGYLIDENDNVVNKEGKVIFEKQQVSKDGEIPKLFPFLKFNVKDIMGEFEMDPLGNPILSQGEDGSLYDNKGNRVNSKGYLIDEHGNVINKKGYNVFSKCLLEEDGDIPKVFRSGLLRKDTNDSFNQLMNEIEHLEKLQDQAHREVSPARQKSQEKKRKGSPNKNKKKEKIEDFDEDRMNKRIDQILEEDNDDDDILMKELEELAEYREYEDQVVSDGGNTSMDSMMGETPSNYNIMNQRFLDNETVRTNAKFINGTPVPEDYELETEYDFHGKKLKKKKKKKKKAHKDDTNYRDLLMAAAYGNVPPSQLEKLKERQREQQLHQKQQQLKTPKMMKEPSHMSHRSSQNRTYGSHFGKYGPSGHPDSRLDQIIPEEENLTDIYSPGEKKKRSQNQSWSNQIPPRFIKPEFRQAKMESRADTGHGRTRKPRHNESQTYQASPLPNEKHIQKNNLMASITGTSFNPDKAKSQNNSELVSPIKYHDKSQPINDMNRKLSKIANSVSGFYRDNMSEHSKKNSTHESNVAQSIQPRRGNPSNQRGRPQRENSNDPEVDRIYGTAKGLADFDLLTDWDKDSSMSRRTANSQFRGLKRGKIRAMESIYLQRLEPAATSVKRQPRKPAKCRVMHHKYHDEADWHIDENLSENSIRTQKDADRYINRKLVEEFHSKKELDKWKNPHYQDNQGENIFYGNFKQYLDKKMNETKSIIDLGR